MRRFMLLGLGMLVSPASILADEGVCHGDAFVEQVYEGATEACAVVVRHFDDDGEWDIAVANLFGSGNGVTVYRGDGCGSFILDTIYTVTGGPRAIDSVGRQMRRLRLLGSSWLN